jgi:hypothetical protein
VSVAHFAAHGTNAAGEEALLLPAGRRLTIDDLMRRRYAHLPFVYLNTCLLGSARYLGGGARRGTAQALVELGAPAVVSNLMPVDDAAAGALASAFYEAAAVHPVGEALRRARHAMAKRGLPAALWSTTVVLGDPELRLHEAGRARRGTTTIAERLLDGSTGSFGDHSALPALVDRGLQRLRRDPDDSRLRAALMLVHCIATAEASQPNGRSEELRFAAELADQLHHVPTAATLRARLAADFAERGALAEAADAFAAAAPLLDALCEVDTRWTEYRLQVYGGWQQVLEADRHLTRHVLETDRSEAERAEELNRLLGSRRIAERSTDEVAWRLPESTVADVLWNAVVSGHPDRFRSLRARADVADALVAKLELYGALPHEQPWGRAILAGLLAHVWKGLGALDVGTVLLAQWMLGAALEDIRKRWSPPDAHVRNRASQLRGRLEMLAARAAPYDPAALLDDVLSAWRTVAAQLEAEEPEAISGCCAYLMGCVIHAHAAAQVNADAAGELHRLLYRLREDAVYAKRFRMYEPTEVAEDDLVRWRREDGVAEVEPVRITFA